MDLTNLEDPIDIGFLRFRDRLYLFWYDHQGRSIAQGNGAKVAFDPQPGVTFKIIGGGRMNG